MRKGGRHYVICVFAAGADDLEVRKVYEVIEDQSAQARGHGVIDESGEDYVYPGDWFVPVQIGESAQRALQAVLTSAS